MRKAVHVELVIGQIQASILAPMMSSPLRFEEADRVWSVRTDNHIVMGACLASALDICEHQHAILG